MGIKKCFSYKIRNKQPIICQDKASAPYLILPLKMYRFVITANSTNFVQAGVSQTTFALRILRTF